MAKLKNITQEIETFAPLELAESWDNVGLLVGDAEQEVKRIFLCLDVTSDVANEAIEYGADVIIAHHPLFAPTFAPLTRIVEQDIVGRIIRKLAKNDISLYVAHTNFDSCDGGLCDILAEKLELKNPRPLNDSECLNELGKPTEKFGRLASCAPTTLGEFVKLVEQKLNVPTIKFAGDLNKTIETVVTVSGAGSDMLYPAYRAGADVLVTADVKHHIGQMASELGIAVIDAGHFETEILFCEFMQVFLREKFSECDVGVSNAKGFFR